VPDLALYCSLMKSLVIEMLESYGFWLAANSLKDGEKTNVLGEPVSMASWKPSRLRHVSLFWVDGKPMETSASR
jgi:hypothetical protein